MSQYPQYPQGPYSPMKSEHPQAQTVLILGIVSLFVAPLGFVAWYMGGKAKKQIAAGAPYNWGGSLKTGYVLGKVFGIITIVGYSLLILFWILYIAFFAWLMTQF